MTATRIILITTEVPLDWPCYHDVSLNHGRVFIRIGSRADSIYSSHASLTLTTSTGTQGVSNASWLVRAVACGPFNSVRRRSQQSWINRLHRR